jgi:hypothetical protein
VKPLTIVLRPRKGLFAGGVPVVQTCAARSGFGGARLLNDPRYYRRYSVLNYDIIRLGRKTRRAVAQRVNKSRTRTTTKDEDERFQLISTASSPRATASSSPVFHRPY